MELLEKFKENPNMAYINSLTNKIPNFTRLDVNNALECEKLLKENINEGERYIFAFYFKSNFLYRNNSGHIVNLWKEKNGELKFYDPQASIFYNSNYLEQIKFQFDKSNNNKKPKILRVDNKELNYDMLNILAKSRENI